MPNTTNFNFPTPADTDLVKDGASAIRSLGNSIDTAFVDLKGGTTGQVLSKTSNTDLDFTWVAQDDSYAIQNALLTTTGDTIYASAASTPARLGIGTAGQVLAVNSGATAPEWKTLSPSAYTLIASGSLSSTETSITGIPSGYKSIRLIIINPDSSSNGFLNIRLNADTGASAYGYRRGSYQSATFTTTATASTIDPDIIINSSNPSARIRIDIPYYADTVWHSVQILAQSGTTSAANECRDVLAYYLTNRNAITSIQLRMDGTKTFDGGTYELYGEN